jgi:hypothetical protein
VRDKLQKSYIVDSIYANVEGPIKLTKGKMKKNVQNRAKISNFFFFKQFIWKPTTVWIVVTYPHKQNSRIYSNGSISADMTPPPLGYIKEDARGG